ncbi:MAG: hypothetical protein KDK51_02740 [Deltaproteobacteria bacterium]|nr:hypothetical protein [Deltaproteobacteria bacterium]
MAETQKSMDHPGAAVGFRRWMMWIAIISAVLAGAAYQVDFVQGHSYAVGSVLMVINIFVIGKMLLRYLHEDGSPGKLMTLLAIKFLVLMGILWILPKLLGLELFSVAVGIFTVAIFAACASVPLLMAQPK